MPTTIAERLRDHNQEHLLRNWDALSPALQESLSRQIDEIDFDLLDRLIGDYGTVRNAGRSPAQMHRVRAPSQLVRLARTSGQKAEWSTAAERGEQLLREGRVGAILVAGGQGTRLGFDQPKGMYSISPVARKSLFQMLAEQLLARSRRAQAPIPYFIMTSDATHDETIAFFEEQRHFGLDPENVFFFRQGTMPAVDARTGQLLLEGPGKLSTSPDGHGGLLQALLRAGLLTEMRERGIDYLHYHQVDNPTAIVCDPAFLGFHALRSADISTKVVAKTGPEEKMGVVVEIDGQTQIIEYSDLPLEAARRLNAEGQLDLWAGNTAMHVFSRAFLDRIVDDRLELPFHLAHKAVPYWSEEHGLIEPKEPNAYKFERFIFDVLPFARTALVVEADREREFNPVKNATGADSPSKVQAGLTKLFASWLQQAGVDVPEGTAVEISPLFALDASELAANVPADFHCQGPVYLGPRTA